MTGFSVYVVIQMLINLVHNFFASLIIFKLIYVWKKKLNQLSTMYYFQD